MIWCLHLEYIMQTKEIPRFGLFTDTALWLCRPQICDHAYLFAAHSWACWRFWQRTWVWGKCLSPCHICHLCSCTFCGTQFHRFQRGSLQRKHTFYFESSLDNGAWRGLVLVTWSDVERIKMHADKSSVKMYWGSKQLILLQQKIRQMVFRNESP